MKHFLGTVSTVVFLSLTVSACSGVTSESDSDDDGLTDKLELALRTSPNAADSDGDGALDGVEFENGTDPLAQDSDSNGVSDGDEDQDRNGTPERKQRAARLHGSDEAPRAANNGGAENRGNKAGQGKNTAGCPGRDDDSTQDGADIEDDGHVAPASSGMHEMTAPPVSSTAVGREFPADPNGETGTAPASSGNVDDDAAPASNGEAVRGATRPASSGTIQQGPAPVSSGATEGVPAPASSGGRERTSAPAADEASTAADA
ncbi:MAG: hypothetical protein ACM3ZE_17750 [Myxococcales bacterium]